MPKHSTMICNVIFDDMTINMSDTPRSTCLFRAFCTLHESPPAPGRQQCGCSHRSVRT